MPIGVALLVVLSALVHAAWNAILKRTRDPDHAVVGVTATAAFTSALVALALAAPAPPARALPWCFLSGVLEAGYFFTLARALARAPLGPVYTIVRGGALALVWPVSVLVLGEEITALRGVGTALVVAGLVATGGTEWVRPRGLAAAAICAAFVGGYHLSYKVALSSGGRPEVVVAVSLSTATLFSVPRAKKALLAARAQPLHVVGAGVLASAGFLVFLYGMERAGAGVVVTLRNTSILFAQVFGVFMGDRPRRLAVIGATLVFGGAVLLAV